MEPRKLSGRCLCGQLSYVAVGEPVEVRVCHCRNCQQETGQPFNARMIYPTDAVVFTGQYKTYASSEKVDRAFCPTCGASVMGFSKRGVVAISIGTLDDPAAVTPTEHFWVASKQPWVTIPEGTVTHPHWPPEYGRRLEE